MKNRSAILKVSGRLRMRIDKNNKDIFHDLKFCYLNVCGLKSRLLCPDFINIIQQNDICVFTETKLTELDQLDLPLDYKIFVKNSKKLKKKHQVELRFCINHV